MDEPTLKFLESQLKAVEDFIAYTKSMKYLIYNEFSPREFFKIAKGLKKIVLDDKTSDEKWKRDTHYRIELLFSYFPSLQKGIKRANENLLRESIKLKKSQS